MAKREPNKLLGYVVVVRAEKTQRTVSGKFQLRQAADEYCEMYRKAHPSLDVWVRALTQYSKKKAAADGYQVAH